MIIDKYTKHSIFSLPLIFSNILSKEDLIQSEFVNMYTFDINKLIYSNHIFLVFHNIKIEVLNRLKANKNFVKEYDIVINKIKFKVLCFIRDFPISNIVNFVNNGKYIDFSFESKMKILKFWDISTKNSYKLHKYLFDDTAIPEKPKNEIITIEDANKKASSLNATGFIFLL